MTCRHPRRDIDEAVVRSVRRQLALAVPMRNIARHEGIGLSTVWRIAGDLHRQAKPIVQGTRCPECGGRLTEVPCRACQLRRDLNRNTTKPAA